MRRVLAAVLGVTLVAVSVVGGFGWEAIELVVQRATQKSSENVQVSEERASVGALLLSVVTSGRLVYEAAPSSAESVDAPASKNSKQSITSKLSRYTMLVRSGSCLIGLLGFSFLVTAYGLYTVTPLDWFLGNETRQQFASRYRLRQWMLAALACIASLNFVAQTLSLTFSAYRSGEFLWLVISIALVGVGLHWVLPAMLTIRDFSGRFSRGEYGKGELAAKKVAKAIEELKETQKEVAEANDCVADARIAGEQQELAAAKQRVSEAQEKLSAARKNLRKAKKLRRYERREGVRTELGLLPNQLDLVEQILQQVKEVDGERPSQITLLGQWGTGKSTIVHNLDPAQYDSSLGIKRELVVVNISVWRYSDPTTFEQQLSRDIFSNAEVARLGGWRVCPPLFLSMRFLIKVLEFWQNRSFGTRGSGRDDALGNADVFPPAEIKYRNQFRQLAKTLWGRNALLVVVIDEIDRTNSNMAQTALTVINRSINIKEAVIIMAAELDHLILKAFRPSQMQSGDLRSTVFADLEKEILPQADAETSKELVKRLNQMFVGCSGSGKPKIEGAGKSGSKESETIKVPENLSPEEQIAYRGQFTIDAFLLEQYYLLPADTRLLMDRAAFRRYAPQRRLYITFDQKDYAAFLGKVISHSVLHRSLRDRIPAKTWEKTLSNPEFIGRAVAVAEHRGRPMPLRLIESDVSEALSGLNADVVIDDSDNKVVADKKAMILALLRIADKLDLEPPSVD